MRLAIKDRVSDVLFELSSILLTDLGKSSGVNKLHDLARKKS